MNCMVKSTVTWTHVQHRKCLTVSILLAIHCAYVANVSTFLAYHF